MAIARDLPSVKPTQIVKIIYADLRALRVAFVSFVAMRDTVSR
jgi:hypothetical protein